MLRTRSTWAKYASFGAEISLPTPSPLVKGFVLCMLPFLLHTHHSILFWFAVIPPERLRGRYFLGVEGRRLRLKDEDPVLVTISVFSRGREGPLASVGQ